MKKLRKLLMAFILIAAVSIFIPAKELYSQQVAVNFQMFYDNLSPYGRWIEKPSYGMVWAPSVAIGFHPYYTSGHWVYAEFGWTWVSDYPWGWAPFHYGRWLYDSMDGWVWVPGTEWGPAWVVWRHCPGYYGWAPIGPGISLTIAFGPSYVIPHEHWFFVQDRYIGHKHLEKYYVRDNVDIIRRSEIIHNTHIDNSRHITYVSGPHKEEVERISKRTIKPAVIVEKTSPGQKYSKGNLQIYRPEVKESKIEKKTITSKPTVIRNETPKTQNKSTNQGVRSNRVPAGNNGGGNNKEQKHENRGREGGARRERK
jgi:hypothetical protein